MRHANISVFVPHMGCPHRCSFCDQNSITGTGFQVTPEDIDAAVSAAKRSPKYSTQDTELAFFGGSFTAIDRSFTEPLLKKAKEYIDSGVISGIRISTRPDYIDDDILTYLKKYGVTAIELGAQSMDDDVLRLNLRGHTAEDVRNASHAIKESGFELGLQMMTGLYGSDRQKDEMTAESIIAIAPKTVRIYPAITLKGTLLERFFNEGKYTPPSLDETVELCAKLYGRFVKNGIRVIRLGLHSIEKESYAAGPWHPSFGELCESRIMLDLLLEKLLSEPTGEYFLHFSPQDVSKMTGQKRKNINTLKEMGYICSVLPREDIPGGTVRYERTDKSCT